MKRIAVLGSTGSIGLSCLEVARAHAAELTVVGLAAHRSWEKLAKQAEEWPTARVALADATVKSRIPPNAFSGNRRVDFGSDAVTALAAADDVDVVVSGIVGAAGLQSTWAALECGKTVAFANKETLVVAGNLMMKLVRTHGGRLLPVDSEHSAVFQSMLSGKLSEIKRIILTASGGPFRNSSRSDMENITVEQALDHPTWDMGRKITIDSATMMNKALEVIEARWLFDLPAEKIEVVVHPQSIVHSMVEFVDGSTIAQLSPPDMKLPLQYALTYPERWQGVSPRMDFTHAMNLEFFPPDRERFPALDLGFEAARRGGTCGAVLSAANETAVDLFLGRQLGFLDIPRVCQAVLANHTFDPSPTLDELLRLDAWAREGNKSMPVLGLSVPSLESLQNILTVMIGLGLVIFFHELGHFAVAKWCGVLVERFSIGFGPILWSRKHGDTEYALSAIPIGGYVKMLGQDDADPGQMADENVEQNPKSYTSKNVPQRMAIISAGVIMNMITAFMFFMAAFLIGVKVPSPTVGYVQPGMPAWVNNIQTGDLITHMNSRRMEDFNDILRETALTRGPLVISGRHHDNTVFDDIKIDPTQNELRRRIGVGPQQSLTVLDVPNRGDFPICLPGTPAESTKVQEGDVIVKVDDKPVDTYRDFQTILGEKRRDEVTLNVIRPPNKSENPKGSPTSVNLKLGPMPFRTIGLQFQCGKIRAVRKDSPAEKAKSIDKKHSQVVGLQAGDRLLEIGHQEIGKDLDPLRMTDFFSQQAGRPCVVTVLREVPGTGGEKIDFTVVPDNSDPWLEPPGSPDSPLSIPSLGIAFDLIPKVMAVIPDSPASGKIFPDETIERIYLVRPKTVPVDGLDKEEFPSNEKTKLTWEWAFWLLQESAATRTVRLVVKDSEGKPRTVDLEPAPAADWFVPSDRGLQFSTFTKLRKAENLRESSVMAYRQTQNSAVEIYLTLRSLIIGTLSIKNLTGPVGIATAAYSFAAMGLSHFLLFLGMISVNLAVVNFLPIPVLDGGHMCFLLWEGLFRRKPNRNVLTIALYIGLIFIVSLMFFVIYQDLSNLKGH